MLDIDDGQMPRDKHDNVPVYTRGRLPGHLVDEFNEGFQQVTEIFSKLGESRGMPWQQVKDRYNRQYSRSNAQNLWNVYSAYFAKNMQAELAWLPGDQQVQGTPSVEIRKECYTLFKQNNPKYIDILETWKESEELIDVGAMVAQCQQFFNKTAKNLDHMVRISCASDWSVVLSTLALVFGTIKRTWN